MAAHHRLASLLPDAWRTFLKEIPDSETFRSLSVFLEQEYREQTVFPPEEDIFTAFQLVPPEKVRAVILGQDPYHDEGQAHGLAFSVREGVRFPPSLRNIFKELSSDLNLPMPSSGSLIPWAEQGILLLNTVLTVRAHQPGSHRNRGWEAFTDAVIRLLSQRKAHLIFILWGAPAQTKLSLIDRQKHMVICSPHPSPLSARRGFFGSRPFSAVNRDLAAHGEETVNWDLSAEDRDECLPGMFQ